MFKMKIKIINADKIYISFNSLELLDANLFTRQQQQQKNDYTN